MSEHAHVKIINELSEQFQPLFQQSPDGIYLYLDEVHKTCSERYAGMFGMGVQEWEAMEGFFNKHIAEEDQDAYIGSYHEHVHQKLTPARLRFKGVRKDGSTFKGETDLIPISWRGEVLALHFVREVE
jgi:hypothetical protein